MNEAIAVGGPRQQSPQFMITLFGFCLSALAVIVACSISFFSKTGIQVANPCVLLLGSLFMLVPPKSGFLSQLQQIIGLYIICVPVNLSTEHSFQICPFSYDLSVSSTAVILLLCVAGYLVGRVRSANGPNSLAKPDILRGWLLALSVVVLHAVILRLILGRFYGYGCERTLSALGTLCLYFLLFIVLWPKLESTRFRQGMGLILGLYYFALFVTAAT